MPYDDTDAPKKDGPTTTEGDTGIVQEFQGLLMTTPSWKAAQTDVPFSPSKETNPANTLT